MGLLVDGEWTDSWYDTKSTGGKFQRSEAQFRNWITADGSAGPSGGDGFKAESGRYHLYVSLACPWAHRTLIFRQLKDLTDHISVDVVHPDMLDKGWTFETDTQGANGDSLFGYNYAHQVYQATDPKITSRVTVPILWDKKRNTIVSNESSEIIRMFNSAFNQVTGNTDDYWPEPLHDAIEKVNKRVYSDVNNGVYKAGFTTTQAAYDEAVTALFAGLDWLEAVLSSQRYLTGDQLTEADWRLFTTLVRFDAVYVSHFKCTRNRLIDFPNLWNYSKELYQMPGIAKTVNFDHITRHYFYSHDTINPNRIVPMAAAADWTESHNRSTVKGVFRIRPRRI